MKQYKAVAGPKNINVGKGDTQSAFNTFAEIINREAQADGNIILWKPSLLPKNPAVCSSLSL